MGRSCSTPMIRLSNSLYTAPERMGSGTESICEESETAQQRDVREAHGWAAFEDIKFPLGKREGGQVNPSPGETSPLDNPWHDPDKYATLG